MASVSPCPVPLTISEMQLPVLRSWMSTVVAPPSAVALEEVEASARGVAEESPLEPRASLLCGESVGVAFAEEEG